MFSSILSIVGDFVVVIIIIIIIIINSILFLFIWYLNVLHVGIPIAGPVKVQPLFKLY